MTGGAALAIAMGDPAGVGPEIIAKSWVVRTLRSLPPFAMVGDAGAVARVWDGPIEVIDDIAEAPVVFDRALPVLAVEPAGDVVPGTATVAGARAALSALECAIALAQRGAAKALVTGPVSKAQLYGIGFNQPGQTEFVAERCGVAAEDAVMMLAGPSLRVVPLTAHVPLAAVPPPPPRMTVPSICLERFRRSATSRVLARKKRKCSRRCLRLRRHRFGQRRRCRIWTGCARWPGARRACGLLGV
mgnify:CR=1 FL=1